MHIRLAVFVTLCVVFPSAAALDYPSALTLYSPPGITESVMGDVNGDGLDDIVTLHTADVSQNPYVGLVSILLQRPSHNFDFPIVYDCGCAAEQLRLIRNPDKNGMDILYASFLSPYIGPDLTKGGFEVVDVHRDGTLTATRRNEMDLFWNWYGVVDVNQDGIDDLYMTYSIDDDSTPALEMSYRIWYGNYRLLQHTTPAGKFILPGRRNAFTLYQGPVQTLLSDVRNSTSLSVDLNGDGMTDLIHGECPGDCLFRQEPYRQLIGAPITVPAGGMVRAAFGDLDGDGLPDIATSGDGRDVNLLLQTTPGTFTDVGSLASGSLLLAGTPVIADLDNNGLNDVVVATEDGGAASVAWTYAWLQATPGQFTFQRSYAPFRFGPLVIDDLNHDGCRDILVSARLEYDALLYKRGRGCDSAIDLGIRVAAVGPLATVTITHDRGVRSFSDKVVRVVVAPTVKDDHLLNLTVAPPAACIAVAAEAPRRMFDCLITRLDPGQQITLPFQVSVAAGNRTSILLTAFLQDGAGDIDPLNNRAQLASWFVSVAPSPSHRKTLK